MREENALTDKDRDWDVRYSKKFYPIGPDTTSWYGRQVFDCLKKNIPPAESTRHFLEVGCAPGKYGILFNNVFKYRVTGIDYSEKGIEATRKNWTAHSVDGKIIHADIFELPDSLFSSFDVLLSAGLIEHFSDPDDVLEIFYSLLKPGGHIITIVPNTGNCLSMRLLFFLKRSKWSHVKKTHFQINFTSLIHYHRYFNVLETKKIVGISTGTVFGSDLAFDRFCRVFLNKLLVPAAKGHYFLQYNTLASHFMIIGQKPE